MYLTYNLRAEKIVLKKLLISPLEFQGTVTKLRQNGSPKIENAIRKMQVCIYMNIYYIYVGIIYEVTEKFSILKCFNP
jgi:hypothetical protein